jgi:hypothetical protein
MPPAIHSRITVSALVASRRFGAEQPLKRPGIGAPAARAAIVAAEALLKNRLLSHLPRSICMLIIFPVAILSRISAHPYLIAHLLNPSVCQHQPCTL